jgi:antitoxin (DNA-binding transcriptional repressor) of toxin-antitoxin stability system
MAGRPKKQKAKPGPEATVKTVKISELKNQLSHYIRCVQQGQVVLICDRDRVVARIDRVDRSPDPRTAEEEWLERLERRGAIRRASGHLAPDWITQLPAVRADLVAALLREREEGP